MYKTQLVQHSKRCVRREIRSNFPKHAVKRPQPTQARVLSADALHQESALVRRRQSTTDAPLFVEEIQVEARFDGWRLDRFLTAVIPRTTRSKVQQYLKHNVELVPPRRVKPSGTVKTGDKVRIVRQERVLPDLPSSHDMEVLARGEDFAVVNKPAGILVHRNSREVSHTVDAFLAQRFSDAPHVEAVHRLDRETSGCLLAAFGREAVAHWRGTFERRVVQKVYLAIVEDPSERWPLHHTELLDTALGPERDSTLSVRMGRGDLPARTHVTVERRFGQRALLSLRPIEGRQHQLRAHLYLAGTPIVGDKLYQAGDAYFARWSADPMGTSDREPLATPFHCLHAWQLTLPVDGEDQTFIAPLPEHFFVGMPSLFDGPA